MVVAENEGSGIGEDCGLKDFAGMNNRAIEGSHRHGVEPNNPIFFIEHQLHEMFPVETGKVLAEELVDVGGASQCAVVFDCALPHERDAIDRYAGGSVLGTVLRISFCSKQSQLLSDTIPPL